MVGKLIIGVVMTVALSAIAGSAYAGGIGIAPRTLGPEENPGLFCYVESSGLCLIAQTDEDCTKLGGVKADSCPAPESGDGVSGRVFCKVENPDVCVIAQTGEGCKKLGGVKVEGCPVPEKEGE